MGEGGVGLVGRGVFRCEMERKERGLGGLEEGGGGDCLCFSAHL